MLVKALQSASLFFLSITFSLHAAPYFICIDGGGSKTEFQILDEKGQPLFLEKEGVQSKVVLSGSTNINTQGTENVRQVLREFFHETVLEGQKLDAFLTESKVIAGLAGILTKEQYATVVSLFEEIGIAEGNLLLMTDADAALGSIEGDGAILIAGTGSICLGKKGDRRYQVGGLGKILSDEGSGYYIGIQAIKAALAEEVGFGPKTKLTPALKELYEVDHMTSLIEPITQGQFSPGQIALAAPLVFEHAQNKDETSQAIIEDAAFQLRKLVLTFVQLSGLEKGEIHVWGGLFKGPYGPLFFSQIFDHSSMPKEVKLFNQAFSNAAVVYAQKKCISYP